SGGIELLPEPGRTVIAMWGDIDATLRTRASEALTGALTRDLPVVVDTEDVQFIDSSGIAFLAQLSTLSREEGLEVRFRQISPAVDSVLSLTGVELVSAA
ncbi:MAG: STAS domain-containing protein, partial [Promicromonosporaceae bacterium]|nr:STAS domain-containing protein [Promicromonosporaceae bacterium]